VVAEPAALELHTPKLESGGDEIIRSERQNRVFGTAMSRVVLDSG
jgi:hypothetical protein